MRADGYATALMVMGDEEGRRFAEEHGLAALFLVREEGGGVFGKGDFTVRSIVSEIVSENNALMKWES